MKTFIKKLKIAIASALILFIAISCEKQGNLPTNGNNNNDANSQAIPTLTQVNLLPMEDLSEAEIASLLYMREEEKLARDVYISMQNKWGTNIFANISGSEQVHMDALLMLIEKYNLTDPVGNNAIGVFNNATLQALYSKLVAQGSLNIANAFTVGATIEDLDIYDLKTALLNIDNQDIKMVYDNLTKGSRNHLRAFYRNILRVGSTYTPQYITDAEFKAIISGSTETGF